MLLMVLQNCPASLKGLLSRWLMEVRSGVFLGNPSSRIRDVLWDRTVLHPRNRGYAIQIWSDQGPQGLAYRTWGEGGRELVDFEGIALVRQMCAKRGMSRNPTAGDSTRRLPPKRKGGRAAGERPVRSAG
jgi:CRISPR-associated protein Cas2